PLSPRQSGPVFASRGQTLVDSRRKEPVTQQTNHSRAPARSNLAVRPSHQRVLAENGKDDAEKFQLSEKRFRRTKGAQAGLAGRDGPASLRGEGVGSNSGRPPRTIAVFFQDRRCTA